jgi:hypothetical protein
VYTPVENLEEKLKDEQQEQEVLMKRDKVAEALTLISVLRCLKPEIVG